MQELQQLQQAHAALLHQVQLKDDQLLKLSTQEKHHRIKIETLARIHAEKTKKLMASLEVSKRDGLRLKDLSRENRRSELIQQLQKESADQDHIISVLRQLINDDDKADTAIIKSLQKGPPRIRVLTREELKIENKALQTQVTSLQNKLKEGTKEEKDQVVQEHHEVAKQDNEQQQDKDIEHKGQAKIGEQFMKKHYELQQEIEAMRIGNTSSQNLIYQLREQLNWKNQEIEKLIETQKDIQVINSKYEELKKLHEARLQASLEEAQHQKDDELNLQKQLILVKNLQGQLQEEKQNVQLLNMKINDLSYDQQKNIKRKNIMVHNNEQLFHKLDSCLKENIALKAQVQTLSQELLIEKKARKALDQENEKQQMEFHSQRTMQEIQQQRKYEALQTQLQQQAQENKELLDQKKAEMTPLLQDNQRLKEELKITRQKEMLLMDQNEALEMELMANKQTNLKQMASRREQQHIDSLKKQKTQLDKEGHQLEALSQLDSDLSMVQSQVASVFVSNSSLSGIHRPIDNSNVSHLADSLPSDSVWSKSILLSVNHHLQNDLDLSRRREKKLSEINNRLNTQYSKAFKKKHQSNQHYQKVLELHTQQVAAQQVENETGKTVLMIKETGNYYDHISDISQQISEGEQAMMQQQYNNYLITSDISSMHQLSQGTSTL